MKIGAAHAGLTPSLGAVRLVVDRWRFAAARADYYDYLAALLAGMQGRRTLKEVFALDAGRYGHGTVRGRLSVHWLQSYQAAGGDLYATWLGSFPHAELNLIRSAQKFGNAALVHTLAQMADLLRFTAQARRILASSLWAGGFAVLALSIMLLGVPWFTLPRLMQTFAVVTPDYYGSLTRALLRLGDLIAAYWPFVLVLTGGASALVLWSLPNTCGRLRLVLDRHAVWRIYRHVQTLRFLGLLTILLGADHAGTIQLRTALAAQAMGATPWLARHVDTMLARIDAGNTGPDTFDTGLLDRDQYWFLSDMSGARGLQPALSMTTARVRHYVLNDIARYAALLRWTLLLTSVGGLLALGMWHYAVIDELRRSLMLVYASH